MRNFIFGLVGGVMLAGSVAWALDQTFADRQQQQQMQQQLDQIQMNQEFERAQRFQQQAPKLGPC